MIRYLLDEHVSPTYRVELLRHNPELVVRRIGDVGVPRKGTPDPDILRWCERDGYILVTNNRHSMPTHLADHLSQGSHINGILTFEQNMPIGDTLDDLLLIAGASFEGEYQDRITYLPLQ